jgi:hypothetical protein
MGCYVSIGDLPVFIFDQINKTGDFSLLLKTKEKKINQIELEKVWENIYNEFIAEFGISETLLLYLKNMRMAINYYIKAYIQGDRTALNLAKVRVNDAEQIFKQESKSSNNIYAIVSKYMGFRINPMEISTREFYQYLKLASTTKDHGKEN